VAGRTPTVEVTEASSRSARMSGAPSAAARHVRARRPALVIVGALVAFVVVATATFVLSAHDSGAGRGHLTVSIPTAANSDIRVDLQNAHESLSGRADATGTVTFGTTVEPGRYDVVVTVDRAATPPIAGSVDIGTARVVYRAEDLRIEEGRNMLGSDRLQQTS